MARCSTSSWSNASSLPKSSYICHDAQFALPFEDGVFSEVFSSTCLHEIPSQAHFIRESRRVTSESGWTMFDAVTPDEDGRVVPTRYYRVCQITLLRSTTTGS